MAIVCARTRSGATVHTSKKKKVEEKKEKKEQ